jgi:tetratricopeptide (TPR) repeat protein
VFWASVPSRKFNEKVADAYAVADLQGLEKVYFDLGDYDAALSAFKKVVSFFSWNDPFYGDSLLWLGGCYEAKNDL